MIKNNSVNNETDLIIQYLNNDKNISELFFVNLTHITNASNINTKSISVFFNAFTIAFLTLTFAKFYSNILI